MKFEDTEGQKENDVGSGKQKAIRLKQTSIHEVNNIIKVVYLIRKPKWSTEPNNDLLYC